VTIDGDVGMPTISSNRRERQTTDMPGTGRSGEMSVDPATARLLSCPGCGANLKQDGGSDALAWTCAAGHIFAGTRSLIAAMRSSGWVPRITVTHARRSG
jgi:hypothetical protein